MADDSNSGYRMFWNIFPRIPYIAILFIIFVYLYSNLVATSLDSNKINDQIIVKRLIYSPNALAYQDGNTKRVYPGTIDMDKINQAQLDAAFVMSDEAQIAARIELKTMLDSLVKEVYVNEIWYKRWSPYTSFDKYDKQIFKRPVLIKNKDDIYPGIIKIHVISPNEN